MELYNTKSRVKEEFVPRDKDVVTMYTCGPTVYHFAHIGNLRTYIMEDILEKSLKYLGYNVKRVMNITDVGHLTSDADDGDDKMVASAKKENKSVLDIALFYKEKFFDDLDKLNIRVPDIISNATDNIDEYIKMIEKLIKDDYAYMSGGNVYFDTSKISDYYSLTNQGSDDIISGVRDTVVVDTFKKNPADFALWFTRSKFDDQELKWDSPFGVGYPGWHIECSAIAIRFLGEYLDIHCGGVDNIFPHHTNEIAQSEAYTGHEWCSTWVHGEHLNDSVGKMSKSRGEFLTLEILVNKGYNPLAYRLMCLQSHYRSQLVFSYDSLDGASNTYKKLKNKVLSLSSVGDIQIDVYDMYTSKFKEYISNDMNTANCVTLLLDVLKSDVNDVTKIEIIKSMDEVLSIDLLKSESIDNEEVILDMISKRNYAKKNKDFELADNIRRELEDMGIVLKDSREGTTYEVLR